MPKYEVDVRLSGTDGNVFSILGKVSTALRRAGVSSSLVSVMNFSQRLRLATIIMLFKFA